MLYLSIFPTTLFLFAVYSESLYLLLTVAAFLLAVRGRWGWAGVVVGLAALTRVSGVILLPALAMLAWRSADRKGALLRLAISLPVMALWPLYLGLVHGRPFVFLSAQRAGWDRRLSYAGPLGGAWDGLVDGWRGVRQLVAGSGHDYFPSIDHSAMYGAGLNLEQLGYAVLAHRGRRLHVAHARCGLRDLRARQPGAAALRSRAELAVALDAALRARRFPGLRRARDPRARGRE